VLAVARRDGTRDGATALVVLRLGGVLYAAHAGDSRAVLCREGQAHRLTEDHKPHLPQVCVWGGGEVGMLLHALSPAGCCACMWGLCTTLQGVGVA
jgi:hypothetical protein